MLLFLKAETGNSIAAVPPSLSVDEDSKRMSALSSKWNLVKYAIDFKLELGDSTTREFLFSTSESPGFGNLKVVKSLRLRVTDAVRAATLECRVASPADFDKIKKLLTASAGAACVQQSITRVLFAGKTATQSSEQSADISSTLSDVKQALQSDGKTSRVLLFYNKPPEQNAGLWCMLRVASYARRLPEPVACVSIKCSQIEVNS